MQSVGATLTVGPHFFLFNGVIQTILVAFSLKTFRACTDMLSNQNDAVKFSKTAKDANSTCITCTIVPEHSWNWYFSPHQSAVDQKHECKSSRRAVLYIFQNVDILILVTFH